ncbi:hypothetical protein [Nocardioides alcanivorans]|uniref:hypothetical protein n=1 Tax=Nocardioides alcanivorans TaxID=2897352 RepID=UPI001F4342FD|nr:hypothetical protein [Nocardioides alcanivorans]
MLIALLTYTLQLVVMAVVLIVISRSELLDGTLDRGWLGGTVIAGTIAWLACQVVVATRVRMPVYDLEEPGAQ